MIALVRYSVSSLDTHLYLVVVCLPAYQGMAMHRPKPISYDYLLLVVSQSGEGVLFAQVGWLALLSSHSGAAKVLHEQQT